MALFRKNKYTTMVARPNIPKDIASKCKRCNTIHIKQELEKNLLSAQNTAITPLPGSISYN